jgi:hypothetical protein
LWNFHAFVFFCALRFHRRQSLIKDIHLLVSIEVEIIELGVKIRVFFSQLIIKLLSTLLNLLLIDVERE